MITTQIRNDFKHFLYNGPAIMTGRQAEMALRDAKILKAWREELQQPRIGDEDSLESTGTVRLVKGHETENYFDSYDDTDLSAHDREKLIETLHNLGVWWVASEYWNTDTQEWEVADSVGMCAGYQDPLDPFENCYIVQLMEAAIEKVRGN